MKLSEAKKIINDFIKAIKPVFIVVNNDEINANLKKVEIEAIETVLQALEVNERELESARKFIDEEEDAITERNNKICELEYKIIELQKENKELKEKHKTVNQIIDEMNLDDEVKRITKESLDYYRNNIYECSVDILRVLYGELLQENEALKFENKRRVFGTLAEVKLDDLLKNEYISKDKIKEKIEEQVKRIDKLLDEMIDKSIGGINVSGLNKKEREQVIAKRNGLLVQKATLQQVKDELLKGE